MEIGWRYSHYDKEKLQGASCSKFENLQNRGHTVVIIVAVIGHVSFRGWFDPVWLIFAKFGPFWSKSITLAYFSSFSIVSGFGGFDWPFLLSFLVSSDYF